MFITRHKTGLSLAVVLLAASTGVMTRRAAASGPGQGGHQHEATNPYRDRKGAALSAIESPRRLKPAARDPNRLWCGEHGVYEDECFICHPELDNRKTGATDDDHAGHDHGAAEGDQGLWCNEHRIAELECGICQPQLAGRLAPGDSLKVRLPSLASAAKAGIRTGRPRLSDMTASIKVFCEVRYNQNRLARVTPLARGVIHSVHADLGDSVEEGELLVEIASSEVADAKRDLLVAIVKERVQRLAYERERRLVEKEISAARNFQQAEAEFLMAQLTVSSARQRLINLGFTAGEVRDVEETKSSSSLVHVHAPFGGTLVERSAVVGEAAVPGTPLFTLADLDVMWLNLLIPESRLSGVTVG
ncbi:MAG: efflux RND transporter periplasmic adaptor subunit, partial [Planctomycetes bacterium]|nr:efflux RND transporter periplasmic adaptor subunit [Planctomycetota bacterium]